MLIDGVRRAGSITMASSSWEGMLDKTVWLLNGNKFKSSGWCSGLLGLGRRRQAGAGRWFCNLRLILEAAGVEHGTALVVPRCLSDEDYSGTVKEHISRYSTKTFHGSLAGRRRHFFSKTGCIFESCTLFAVSTDLVDRLLGVVRNDLAV